MPKHLFFFLLLFASCTSQQSDEGSTDSLEAIHQNDTLEAEAAVADTLATTQQTQDTIFLERTTTKDYYHAIYIDQSRDSEFRERLTDFNFYHYDPETYEGSYNYIKKQKPETFQYKNPIDLPAHWLPAYLHKGQYYLYAPSDWGNAGRRIINDSAFVYWYMDGPLPVPLTEVRQVENGTYVVEMIKPFNGDFASETLTIHPIDPETQLSIFEYANEPEQYRYRLYIPVESADQFDMVVNYCRNQKQYEFDFDEVDFEGLLKEAGHIKKDR